jgi:heptaprenyl diphosphate synthase
MSFQLVDDILDLIGDPDRMGKPVGSDLQNGVLTLPILLGLGENRSGQLFRLLLSHQHSDLEQAANLVIASGRVDETKLLARQFAANASRAVSGMRGSEAEGLSRFASSYVDWALERFAAV